MVKKSPILLFFLGIILLLSSISLERLQTESPPTGSPTKTPAPHTASPTQKQDNDVLGEKNLEWVTVTKIVDGDTIKLSNGKTLRYIGIDTPETVDPRRPVGCFGKEASEFNKELVQGKTVGLEKDVSNTDRYGRLLRYVYLEDGRMVNEILVQEGYANASAYPPDVKYQEKFEQAEKQARQSNQGLWGSCEVRK